jgi:membrane protein YdbS with pleckstrin-like domain
MPKLSQLSKLFWRILFAKIGLLSLMISFFILLTIFTCAVLVMDYNWFMLEAGAICLVPWIIVIIIVYIFFRIDQKKYTRGKHELLENGRMALITRIITFAIQYLLNRRRKAKSEHE